MEPEDRHLADPRLRAEAASRADDDATLVGLLDQLRERDPEFWPHWWAPLGAVALRRTGSPEAFAVLDEAVALGFCQPEALDGRLEELFGDDPGWTALAARMAQPPAPGLELTDWPDPLASAAVALDRTSPEREAELRRRVPDDLVTDSSWSTAVAALRWVHTRWEHANDHVDTHDAVDVLDQVALGRRFACVEYSVVLSQLLNALGIPARRGQGLQAHHHVGFGRGHVFSEAWIDELGAWVVLDGQHGGWWVDPDDDRPLGLAELAERHREGRSARLVCLRKEMDDATQAVWGSYFATVATTGVLVPGTALSPVFQGVTVVTRDRITRSAAVAWPDLDAVTTGVGGEPAAPYVTFGATHPFALGLRVTAGDTTTDVTAGEPWPLDLTPGEHEAGVSVRTPYGVGRSHLLRWRARR